MGMILKAIWSQLVTLFEVLRHTFTKADTIEYPEEMPYLAPRYRGRIVLTRDPDGEERCVACNLCAVVCPVDCIHPLKDEEEFEKETMLYIDPDECIDCGACIPECPVDAIFDEGDLPPQWSEYTQINEDYYN